MRSLKILDLFAGVGGERRRSKIESRGHTYTTLDLDPRFGCTITADIMTLSAAQIGSFDFVWASPPCEAFSVAYRGHHWSGDSVTKTPKTAAAVAAQKLVAHTIAVIQAINPRCGFLIENPRGILRKLPVVATLPRVTVTYCQYGETRQKPTDLWGAVPGWKPRPACVRGSGCHEAAPRGARTGTQGIKGAAERAVVPWPLWDEILTAAEAVP